MELLSYKNTYKHIFWEETVMKKVAVVILAFVMVISLVSGCCNPIVSEYEEFVNVYMVDINENYEKIVKEASSLEGGDETLWITTLEDVLIPLCDETLVKINEIKFETQEVNSLKDKFYKVISFYKEGFEILVDGIENVSEEKIEKGRIKIEEGIEILGEYNERLEAIDNFVRSRKN